RVLGGAGGRAYRIELEWPDGLAVEYTHSEGAPAYFHAEWIEAGRGAIAVADPRGRREPGHGRDRRGGGALGRARPAGRAGGSRRRHGFRAGRERRRMSASAAPVAVFGFDAADAPLVERGLAEGWLPTLRRLAAEGGSALLDPPPSGFYNTSWIATVTGRD